MLTKTAQGIGEVVGSSSSIVHVSRGARGDNESAQRKASTSTRKNELSDTKTLDNLREDDTCNGSQSNLLQISTFFQGLG